MPTWIHGGRRLPNSGLSRVMSGRSHIYIAIFFANMCHRVQRSRHNGTSSWGGGYFGVWLRWQDGRSWVWLPRVLVHLFSILDSLCTTSVCFQTLYHSISGVWRLILLKPWRLPCCLSVHWRCPSKVASWTTWTFCLYNRRHRRILVVDLSSLIVHPRRFQFLHGNHKNRSN